MASLYGSSAMETTDTEGTGTLSLGGAVAGFTTIVGAIGTGNTSRFRVEAVDGDGVPTGEWEEFVGVVTDANPDTLTRASVLKSSNSNNAVTLSAGTKRVYIVEPGSHKPFFTLTSAADGDFMRREAGVWVNTPNGLYAEPTAPGGAADLEFNSATIGGTALGSPATIDANTTVPGALYISASASASFALTGRYWTIAGLGISTPFTMDAEIQDAENLGSFSRHTLFIGEATPGKTLGIYSEYHASTPLGNSAISTISTTSPTGGAAYVDQRFTEIGGQPQGLQLRFVVTSSTNISMYWRRRGMPFWRVIRTAYNPSFTVGSVGVSSHSESASFGVRSAWSHVRFS